MLVLLQLCVTHHVPSVRVIDHVPPQLCAHHARVQAVGCDLHFACMDGIGSVSSLHSAAVFAYHIKRDREGKYSQVSQNTQTIESPVGLIAGASPAHR